MGEALISRRGGAAIFHATIPPQDEAYTLTLPEGIEKYNSINVIATNINDHGGGRAFIVEIKNGVPTRMVASKILPSTGQPSPGIVSFTNESTPFDVSKAISYDPSTRTLSLQYLNYNSNYYRYVFVAGSYEVYCFNE